MKQTLRITSIFCAILLFFIGCQKEETKPLPIPPTAIAGNSQTVQLPTNTITIVGTGSTTNANITGYLWSLISGPNVPVISSPSSATTAIKGLILGTYIFQFAVIDNAGLTGIDTISVLVKAALQQTVTIQPANNPNDTHVDSYNLVGGAGDTEIEIGSWTVNGASTNWRSFIKFDQNQVPTNAIIINATLYLYAMPTPKIGSGVNSQSGTANAFHVERITANWNPAQLYWNSQPISTIVNRVTVPQSTSSTANSIIDVTGILQDMQINGNFGFAFRLQSETIYNMREYASSFYSNAALHPKLVITYQ